MKALFGLLVLLVFTPALASAADSLGEVTPRMAVVEVEGPMSGGTIRLGDHLTTVVLQLESGETRRLRVPFSATQAELDTLELDFDFEGGTARFLEWEAPGAEQRWERLPAGLRGRPIPAPSGVRARPTPLAFGMLAGGLLLVYLLRSRPVICVLVGGGAAVLLVLLPAVEEVGSSRTVVLEGDSRSGSWIRIEVRDGVLEVELERLLRLGVVPGGAAVDWVVQPGSPGPAIFKASVRSTPGARLVSAEAFERPLLSGGGEATLGLVDFRASWTRAATSGAEIEARGAWPSGEPLPAIRADDPPPGWLVAGLPPGTEVLLGRVELSGGEQAWLRLFHFPIRD